MIILRQNFFSKKDGFTHSTNDLSEIDKIMNEKEADKGGQPKQQGKGGKRGKGKGKPKQPNTPKQPNVPKPENEVKKAIDETKKNAKEKGENFIKRTWKSGTLGKVALIGTPIVLTGGGIAAYRGIKKHGKNQDKERYDD